MRKKILLLTGSIILGIGLIVMLSSGSSGKIGVDEFTRMLNKTKKSDKALLHYFIETEEIIKESRKVDTQIERLISRKDNYYAIALKHAKKLDDEELKNMLIKLINKNQQEYATKRSQSTSTQEQLKAHIKQQQDVSMVISILASLPTERADEKKLDELMNAAQDAKNQLREQIKEGKTRIE